MICDQHLGCRASKDTVSGRDHDGWAYQRTTTKLTVKERVLRRVGVDERNHTFVRMAHFLLVRDQIRDVRGGPWLGPAPAYSASVMAIAQPISPMVRRSTM